MNHSQIFKWIRVLALMFGIGAGRSPSATLALPMGCGLDFDGADDVVTCGNSSSFTLTTSWSISLWARMDTTPDNSFFVWKVNTYGMGYGLTGFGVGGLSARFAFSVYDQGTSWHTVSSQASAVAGQWYHLVGTFDGAALSIYVNGQLSASTGYSGLVFVNSNQFTIGTNVNHPLDGALDEIGIWDTSLTLPEIQALYNNGFGQEIEPGLHTRAIYHLNEGVGQTTADASGNNNTGTFGNSGGIDIYDPIWSCASTPTATATRTATPALTSTPTATPTRTATLTPGPTSTPAPIPALDSSSVLFLALAAGGVLLLMTKRRR